MNQAAWGQQQLKVEQKCPARRQMHPEMQHMMNEAQLHFRECELCDRKSPGFVWITATAARSYCKNPPAAFLVSAGLLNKERKQRKLQLPKHHMFQRRCRSERVNKGHHRGFIDCMFVALLFGMHPPPQMLRETDVNSCNVFCRASQSCAGLFMAEAALGHRHQLARRC